MTRQPVHFGEGHRLLGWWERPAGAPRGVVVLVEPPAYEGMCAHWAFARLSTRLAAQGFAVLRVDLLGTGDSADLAEDAPVVDAWQRSVHEACDAARAWSAGAPLSLLGLRLGATLAAAVAAARDDVQALVLLDPSASGRTWLREQKALALTSGVGIGGPAVEDTDDGGQSILGYRYSPHTQATLSALKLDALPRPGAPAVLVIHRDDRPLDAKALRALGPAEVVVSEQGGLTALLQDTVFSTEPTADFARVERWFAERFAAPASGPALADAPRARLAGDGYEEEAQLLGPFGHLAAVTCTPTGARRGATLVILNTGANHRVGSHRTSVMLARTLAREGFPSVRFDLGGVGDSPPRGAQQQNFPYNRGNVDDTGTVLDWLARQGHRRFVLTGICSGGNNAFHTALGDERVHALVLTNTQRFIWKDGDSLVISMRKGIKSTEHYQSAAMRLETWKRLVKGEVDVRTVVPALTKRLAKRALRSLETRVARTLGPRFERDPVARGFLTLCRRGVKVSFVLSAADGARDELDLHLGPGLGALQGEEHVAVEILENTDHTLTSRAAQQRLLAVVRGRLEEVSRESAGVPPR